MARPPGVKPADRLPRGGKGQRQHEVGHKYALPRPEDEGRRDGQERHRNQPGHGERRCGQFGRTVDREAAAAVGQPRGDGPLQRQQRQQPSEHRHGAQVGHADARHAQHRQRQVDIERADIVLHHQREGTVPHQERGAAEGRDRRRGEQFHRVDAGLARLIVVQAGQAELMGGQEEIEQTGGQEPGAAQGHRRTRLIRR